MLRRLHALLPASPKPLTLEHAGHFTPEWGDEFVLGAMESIAAQIAARRTAEAAGEGEGAHASA